MINKLILATRNPGKVREIRALLGDLALEIIDLGSFLELPEVIEDGQTLEQNSIKKARTIFQATKLPALADDSGLEVQALGMRPGVFSARYAGDHASFADNNRKLMDELKGIPEQLRSARFRCVAAFVAEGVEHLTEGICEGLVASQLRGVYGFGYDPLFIPNGFQQSFAELPPEVKNKISHRAKAFQAMQRFLLDRFRQVASR